MMSAAKHYRNHRSYWAFLGLRFSGIALTLFLPVHFLMLGLAFEGAPTMDHYLALTHRLSVKIAEWGLVTLLALHCFFGLRLLVLELFLWPNPQADRKSWVPIAGGAAVAVGAFFFFRAL